MKSLPKSVKIGPLDFSVARVEKLQDEGREPLRGRISQNDQKIQVEHSLPIGVQRYTMWHEVVHEIYQQAGIRHNERMVDAVALGVMKLLQENPYFRSEE